MKLFKSTKQPSPAPRHVTHAGRTTPFSYHMQRSAAYSSGGRQSAALPIIKRQQSGFVRLVRRHGAGLIVLAAVIGVVGYNLTLSTHALIAVAPSSNTVLQPLPVYQQFTEMTLNDSLMNRLKPTIDVAAVDHTISVHFPELSHASLSIPFLSRRPTLTLVAAQPVLVLHAIAGTAYIIDANGRALAIASQHDLSNPGLVNVTDNSGTPITLGHAVLPPTDVTFIRTIGQQMSLQHLAVTTFSLPPAASELDMQPAGSNYNVKFNLYNDSAVQQVGTFLAVRHALAGKGIVPQAYIDVRIDGRAYYK